MLAFLVGYGKSLYLAGKAYGVYAETINSVAVERPLIRCQLTTALDLAFAWLADEPHSRHPAMPLSIMVAMVVTALYWGWPFEASVLLMGWTGVMRIAARRKDLVLPCDAAPGTSFLLVVVRQPKTRGRSANHQAARIDQEDVIRFLTSMYRDADRETFVAFLSCNLEKKCSRHFSELLNFHAQRLAMRNLMVWPPWGGGATWLLHQTESPDYVRRRGRWLSARVMEVYLQETLAVTCTAKLSPRTKCSVQLVFLDTGMPPRAWYSLLECRCSYAEC